MDLTLILQILQVFLAFYVITCFYTKGKNNKNCSCCGLILILVVSIMIIPPIGRNYMSAVTINNLGK